MHNLRIISLDEVGLVPTPAVQCLKVCVAGAPLGGRAGDFVAVEVQNRKNGTLPHWVKKVDRLPASLKRTGLRFTVTNYAGNNQIRIVECRSKCVTQRIAELSTLMHGVRHVRSAVAG